MINDSIFALDELVIQMMSLKFVFLFMGQFPDFLFSVFTDFQLFLNLCEEFIVV